MYFTQKQMWKREDDEVAWLPAGSTRRTVKSEQQHLSPHAHIRDSTETAYFTSSPSSSLSSSTVHSTFPEPRTFPPEFSPPSSRLVRHGFIRFRSGSRASSLFFSFFFFEGKQVECFTENEHHPQVKSLSPGPARSEWHGFPPPGIHDTANGWPGTKWKAATTAAERSPPRHPRAADHVLRQQAVAALLHPTSNGKEKGPLHEDGMIRSEAMLPAA